MFTWQVMVLAVFVAYIGGAIYGLTTLQEGLQRRKLSRADSYSIEFYDREDFYFREFPYRMQVSWEKQQSATCVGKNSGFNVDPCGTPKIISHLLDHAVLTVM